MTAVCQMHVKPVLLSLLPVHYALQVVTAKGQALCHLCRVTSVRVLTSCCRFVSLALHYFTFVAPFLPEATSEPRPGTDTY